jgi:pilus assembly protein CpaF
MNSNGNSRPEPPIEDFLMPWEEDPPEAEARPHAEVADGVVEQPEAPAPAATPRAVPSPAASPPTAGGGPPKPGARWMPWDEPGSRGPQTPDAGVAPPPAPAAPAPLPGPPPAAPPPPEPRASREPAPQPGSSRHGELVREMKGRVHRRLLERLNLSNVDALERAVVLGEIRRALHDLLAKESIPLNYNEREALVLQILDEIFGFGPLEPLLKDPEVSDILVNTHKQVIIETGGKLHVTDVRFSDDRHLMQVIERIVSAVGRRVDESAPMVDARLPDGSRVNAIIPPLAIDGPHLSIRKFKRDALSGEDLLRTESLTPGMLELLRGIVKARLNVLISGGTGAGKTTLLNVLSSYIPHDERIVTIEDSAELQLRQPHVVRLETRPANIEGHGEVPQRLLLINALRMRPDRVVVGEVRGGEAIDMLQAMNTGHDGSITTLHANTPRDALGRLETMISMANLNLPEKAMRQQISSAIDVIIQVSRLSDGKRKLTSISELVGMEGEIITMQEIFAFQRDGVDEDGRVIGQHRPTGIRPKFADRLRSYGIRLPATLFTDAGSKPAGGETWSA